MRQQAFIAKVNAEVTRRGFSTYDELRTAVYAALRRATSGSSEERSLQTTQKTTPETTIETTIENLGVGTRAVYDALVTSPTSNLEQIVEKTGMTKDGVFYHVKVLRKELGLRHEGSTKKGRWVFDGKGKRR